MRGRCIIRYVVRVPRVLFFVLRKGVSLSEKFSSLSVDWSVDVRRTNYDTNTIPVPGDCVGPSERPGLSEGLRNCGPPWGLRTTLGPLVGHLLILTQRVFGSTLLVST